MSGHSKWATIKRKKGATDAKRGAMFSKIIKEITVAARLGGGDPDSNSRLRMVIDKAKAANMPADNVTRAIKKGTGELEGVNYEEGTLEGYGPAGVAVFVEIMTDNRNRTVAEVRHMLSKHGGNLGESNSVAWVFDKRGVITIDKPSIAEDKLMDIALEAGAEDIKDAEDVWEVQCDPSSFMAVKDACEKAALKIVEAAVQMVPQNTVKLEKDDAEKMLKLMDALEEHDDVQNVYANFDIDPAIMEQLG
ncbi:MAG: YebC/PmpR family DNA-binding transcriptional regulator [Deltaproteobacteria bacterium CG11_big_fil_rev_8_21_14_0_20_47_16]|nr:MAG: YebC/PmpR family DNA-binding transcriptional regulator [Deltaproteobacteria bacterium CG11_big_fil_rev_8_21_14_0_20_47_16]